MFKGDTYCVLRGAYYEKKTSNAEQPSSFTSTGRIEVTGKALDGLFKMVGGEEKNIRANPVARSTEVLKSVFGAMQK